MNNECMLCVSFIFIIQILKPFCRVNNIDYLNIIICLQKVIYIECIYSIVDNSLFSEYSIF